MMITLSLNKFDQLCFFHKKVFRTTISLTSKMFYFVALSVFELMFSIYEKVFWRKAFYFDETRFRELVSDESSFYWTKRTFRGEEKKFDYP